MKVLQAGFVATKNNAVTGDGMYGVLYAFGHGPVFSDYRTYHDVPVAAPLVCHLGARLLWCGDELHMRQTLG